jgi:hypothetical protein
VLPHGLHTGHSSWWCPACVGAWMNEYPSERLYKQK